MIKRVGKDFLNFIKKPDDSQIEIGIKGNILFSLIFIFFNLIISYFLLVPILIKIYEIANVTYNDYETSILKEFIIFVIITPFLEELVFRYFLSHRRTKVSTIDKWNKIFPYLVYFSVICFAFMHVMNFSNNSLIFYLLSPIIISSQFISGFIIAFIRVRLGFIWGLLYHWVWNFLVVFAIPFLENLLY